MLDVDTLIYEENSETLTSLINARFELMVKRINELDEYAIT
jgi:hypothetical protein